jgi:hypothetical protein
MGALAWAACSASMGACSSKTPVPFKREPAESSAADAPGPAPDAPTSGTSYDDATRRVSLEAVEITRSQGSFRAVLPWSFEPSAQPTPSDQPAPSAPQPGALVVSTDERGAALLESWVPGPEGLRTRDTAPLLATADGCKIASAALGRLGPKLALATLELACASLPPARANAKGAPGAADTPAPEPEAPPEPESVRREHHSLVLTVEGATRTLVHLASLPPASADDMLSLTLHVTGVDQDHDGYPDVHADAELSTGGEALHVPLAWLNRPSGLSRERAEPETTLATLAEQAYQQAQSDPVAALPLAERVLAVHAALCQESGGARLLVDESVGLTCGASAAAGRAAVVQTLALAKKQQLMPALAARARLDSPAYKVAPADRERVLAAMGTIRGQTSFTWQRGPALSTPSAPRVRLPALAFSAEEQLILRGALAQSYDLRTRSAAPTSAPQGVVMSHPNGHYAVVDLLADCDGRYLRVVPAGAIVSGYVAATSGKDVSLGEGHENLPGCSARARRSDTSGSVVLGLSAEGAIVVQGMTVRVVPLDAQGGGAGPVRTLSGRDPVPALLAPGALSSDGRRHAVVTSEGVALVERGVSPSTTLVRSPASCTGRISDVALSPSGQRIAMLCNGTVYWAEPTAATSASALTPNTPPAGSAAGPQNTAGVRER